MSKSRALVCLLVFAVGFSIASSAAVADRISGSLNSGPMVAVKGNVHGLAKPQYDIGRADSSRVIHGISIAFHPSAAQQTDLNNLIEQLGDPSSPNYHKYLTPAQFGARFGMSQNDIAQVTAWLVSHGFANIKVSNSRNQISFDGTIAQIESTFAVEIHNYVIDGVTHFANSGNPSVPAAMAGTVLHVGHLTDFAPKPRIKVRSHLTSYLTGNHFLSPADFATIYDLQPLYTAGITGNGQKIAVVGQSTVSTTDLNNFRSASGLPASTVTMTLMEGTATRCAGDEGESDLDLEWSGGVAQKASINFVYAGLDTTTTPPDTCANRSDSVWDALQYAVDNNVAPFISTSYGYCESGLGSGFVDEVEGWAQQGITQGQTITSASGDDGAADCEQSGSTSATTGLAVDAPASIPEVTGAGGNEFTGDTAGTVTGNQAAADPPYWAASGAGSDAVSTALEYIPEMAWNDTAEDGELSASGGGASIYFSKPSWQTGTGVPADGQRDVPDVSITASADHDGYLICSEDGENGTIATTCTDGFRDGAGGDFDVVGGTSAAAPTTTAIFALVNQYLGNTPPTGLAPINPTLYTLPGNNPSPFHDVTSGNNEVPCTSGTTDCPTGTTEIGFSAGVGYDQVTGLGSFDGYNFAQIMKRTPTTVTISPSSTSIGAGGSVTFTSTVTPSTATGMVSYFNNGSTTALGSGTLSGGTATYTATTLPGGSDSVVAVYSGDTDNRLSTSTPVVISVAVPGFTVGASPTTATAVAGATATSTLTLAAQNGFTGTVSFSCPSAPAGISCSFNPSTASAAGGTTQLTIQTSPDMAPGTSTVTVQGVSGTVTAQATVSVTLTATTETFTITASPSVTTISVAQGQTSGAVNLKVSSTSTPSFVGSGQTAVPVQYLCAGLPSEASCNFSPSATSSALSITMTVVTTAPTTKLAPPLDRGPRMFYALLLPGLFGIILTIGSRKRTAGTVRMLLLIAVLGLSVPWMVSCGGSSSGSSTTGGGNAGTPVGNYTITVNAKTAGSGTAPITATPALTFQLTVTQ